MGNDSICESQDIIAVVMQHFKRTKQAKRFLLKHGRNRQEDNADRTS